MGFVKLAIVVNSFCAIEPLPLNGFAAHHLHRWNGQRFLEKWSHGHWSLMVLEIEQISKVSSNVIV